MTDSDGARLARIEKQNEMMTQTLEELVTLLGGRLERNAAETDARFQRRKPTYTRHSNVTGRIESLAAYPVASHN